MLSTFSLGDTTYESNETFYVNLSSPANAALGGDTQGLGTILNDDAMPMHTVTFNNNGGSGSMSNQVANVPTALTLNTFTRTGYSFSGWNTLAGGTGTAYANWANYSFGTDVTLYAQWTASTANVVVTVTLQGSGRPDPAGYVVPLTVNFFTPGADVLTAAPLYTRSLTTAKSGSTAVATATAIPSSTYDISAVTTTCLTNVKRGVVITAPLTALNLGTLLEGNANDDNIVNITDFGILAATYGKSTPDYDNRADFDGNGIINIADFGLLAANYGQSAPVGVP